MGKKVIDDVVSIKTLASKPSKRSRQNSCNSSGFSIAGPSTTDASSFLPELSVNSQYKTYNQNYGMNIKKVSPKKSKPKVIPQSPDLRRKMTLNLC